MNPELKLVIFEEKNILQDLLELLDKQYQAILSKEVIQLEKFTGQIECVGKKLAAAEIKRRKLINEDDFKGIIENCNDEHVKNVYEEIKSILNSLELQKSTNDTLIKQKLFFTNNMINVIRPSKTVGTYNSYGKVGR